MGESNRNSVVVFVSVLESLKGMQPARQGLMFLLESQHVLACPV